MFGLNTLGGALAINTKDGFRYPAARVEVSAGSFGRVEASADAGGAQGPLAAFAAGEALDDDGWRDHSPSRIRPTLRPPRLARSEPDDGSVAATLADNHLDGTQALPVSMLAQSAAGVHVAGHHGQPARVRQRDGEHAFAGRPLSPPTPTIAS